MSAVTVKLPESLIEQLRELTANQGITVDQFIASAVAEKLNTFLTIDHLRRRTAGAKRKDFEAFLNLSPEIPPAEND